MRSEVSQSGVFPFEVVVGDVVADDSTSSSLMVILGHFEFSLECSARQNHSMKKVFRRNSEFHIFLSPTLHHLSASLTATSTVTVLMQS